MNLALALKNIIREQQTRFNPIPVDITLSNGNIVVRSFHIQSVMNNVLTGLTATEAYIHPREERSPEYCKLNFAEIKELQCSELGIHYINPASLQPG